MPGTARDRDREGDEVPRPIRRAAVALAAVLAGLLSQSALVHGVGAGFTAIMGNNASSWAAAASFPSYGSTVLADSPSIDYRADDAASATAGSAATDSSGNSRTGTYDGSTSGPSQWWRFDQGSGTTVADRSGGGWKGTLNGGVTWATGKYGTGVNFPSASFSNSVVSSQLPIRTSQSFSVAAWVNISDTAGVRTAVSAGTTGSFSGFYLKYDAGQWRFSMPYSSNTANGSMDQIGVAAGSPTGQWVHLVGVYNASTYLMTLYVNGASAATGTRSTATGAVNWDATGGLTLGQSRYAYSNPGIVADPWIGTIDDVRLYSRALSASDVSTVYAGTDTPPAADWRFDDGDDNTFATDASGNGNTLSLTNVPATPNSRFTGANGTARSLVLSGSSYGQAPKTVVRTDQSFTVAAWLRNTDTTAANWHRGVTESGAHSSAFTLEYRGDNQHFGFSLANSDIDGATWTNVYSTTTVAANTWYHVVGVYDATAGVIRIYVNGVQEGGDVARSAPGWTASGVTLVGRGIFNSVMDTTTQWVGDIDEVELYQRALTSAEVTSLKTNAYPVGSAGAGQVGATGPSGSLGSAVAFNGSSNAYYGTAYTAANVPTTNFSEECWFRTDSFVGGALMGFAAPSAGQGSTNDKMVYLNSSGAIVYGVYTGTLVTVSTPSSYNDGNWHHLVVTQSSTAGATIYVDGAAVASSSSITAGQAIAEYWRWGGQSLTYWPNRPASDFFVGTLDEVALYPTALSATQVQLHYYARAR
jgi:hypothetical protein